VNEGLRAALALKSDVVLADPSVEFRFPGWLEALTSRLEAEGRPVGVTGARLLHSNGNVHRAGYLFSRLTREWQARLEHAPSDLHEAQLPLRCPVDAELLFVRHDALARTGVLDARMPAPLDSIDFCLRVHQAGFDSILEPAATAVFTGTPITRDTTGAARFDAKWHGTDFSPWVPPII
jgi:GT2 family glycosyltransferase